MATVGDARRPKSSGHSRAIRFLEEREHPHPRSTRRKNVVCASVREYNPQGRRGRGLLGGSAGASCLQHVGVGA